MSAIYTCIQVDGQGRLDPYYQFTLDRDRGLILMRAFHTKPFSGRFIGFVKNTARCIRGDSRPTGELKPEHSHGGHFFRNNHGDVCKNIDLWTANGWDYYGPFCIHEKRKLVAVWLEDGIGLFKMCKAKWSGEILALYADKR